MFYTYILRSETSGKYYTGSTGNLEERLRRHNNDHSKPTKGNGPWAVVYFKEHTTRSEAVKLEHKIKKRGAGLFLQGYQGPG
jgi:putative endonuclease